MTYYLTNEELYHHGILGQKWGIRRYQNYDGSYTRAGLKRYNAAFWFWWWKNFKRSICRNAIHGSKIKSSAMASPWKWMSLIRMVVPKARLWWLGILLRNWRRIGSKKFLSFKDRYLWRMKRKWLRIRQKIQKELLI